MSHRVAKAVLYPLAALLTCAASIEAQAPMRPFTSVALNLGLGAGLGFDIHIRERGWATVGSRVGYLARSTGDDNSIAYVTVSLGLAAR